jgi:peptidyl-prolyl cis-trans isomerase A (cyclophilin A)
MAQIGIHGDPKVNNLWRGKTILDDSPKMNNRRGTVTFAHAGKNTRVNQIFFNFVNNGFLDKDFTPFAEVISGMEYVDSLYSEYGEGGNGNGGDGRGPAQGRIQIEGNKYLERIFPKLSYIIAVDRLSPL